MTPACFSSTVNFCIEDLDENHDDLDDSDENNCEHNDTCSF